MKRWLVIALGFGIAAAGFYGLARTRVSRSAAPPHAEIGEASHARLEQLLRDAEPKEAR